MKTIKVMLLTLMALVLLSACQQEKGKDIPVNNEPEQEKPVASKPIEGSASEEKPAEDIQANEDRFFIFTGDAYTGEPLVVSELMIDENESLFRKVQAVTAKLSTDVFGLPIELKDIIDYHGLKIAIVNVSETGSASGPSWRADYLENFDAGDRVTVAFQKTLLQEDYSGQWIDGFYLHYENQPIEEFYQVWQLMKPNFRTSRYVLSEIAIGDSLNEYITLTSYERNPASGYTYFEFDGSFPVKAKVFFDFEWRYGISVTPLYSPIQTMAFITLDQDNEEYVHKYTIMDIKNMDELEAQLTQDQLARINAGETLELDLVMKNMSTILYWQSEYYNIVEFVGFQ